MSADEDWTWNLETQSMRRRSDRAQEVDWRRSVLDTFEKIQDGVGKIRETGEGTKAALEHKASKAEVQDLRTEVELMRRDLQWVKGLVASATAVIALIEFWLRHTK